MFYERTLFYSGLFHLNQKLTVSTDQIITGFQNRSTKTNRNANSVMSLHLPEQKFRGIQFFTPSSETNQIYSLHNMMNINIKSP